MRLTIDAAFAMGAVIVLSAHVAFADPVGPIEVYDVAQECPDKTTFVAAIERNIPPENETGPLSIVATKNASGFTLNLRSNYGERQLAGEQCDELVLSAALIIAIAAEPPALEQEPDPLPKTPDQEVSLPLSAKKSVNGFSRHVGLGIETQINVGLLPDAAAGFGASLSLFRNHWRLETRATLSPTQRKQNNFGEGSTFSYQSVDSRLCAEKWAGDIVLGLCMGGFAGQIISNGFGIIGAQYEKNYFFGPNAAATMLGEIGQNVSWKIGLTVSVPMPRTHFVLETIDESLYRTSIVSYLLNFGVDWILF